jgi:hypothetical protein
LFTQVALLFLARDGSPLPNEPVWRAFFEAAARLQLQPAAATAAAAAAECVAASNIKDLLGSRPLHPALQADKPWTYIGYQIQHGMQRGAWRPAPEQIPRNGSSLRYSNSSSSNQQPAWQQYSAAVLPQEQQLLQQEMQRLLQLAPSTSAMHTNQQQQQQQQQQQTAVDQAALWDPLKQLATADQAAAQAAVLHAASVPISSTAAAQSGFTRRPWKRQQRSSHCGSSSSSSTDSTRRGPLHPVLTRQQLFSVYVHTPDGVVMPPDSIFAGSELRVRLNTTMGYAQHVLAEAAVLLLQAALQDELNVQFVMVSDTSIPIYPPQVRHSRH